MIRRLIILLLIVGCEESGITSNGLTDGTAVTDTLYISNDTTIYVYDTLIVNYDTTIYVIDTVYIDSDDVYGCTDATACNFDSTATIFDNSCHNIVCGVCGGSSFDDACVECGDGYVLLWDSCYSIVETNSLSLSFTQLSGSISPQIGDLIHLNSLYVNHYLLFHLY